MDNPGTGNNSSKETDWITYQGKMLKIIYEILKWITLEPGTSNNSSKETDWITYQGNILNINFALQGNG